MSTYSKLPVEPFKQIAFNAGVIASTFDVSTRQLTRANILFATTGGSQFQPNLNWVDLFEDIDNGKPGTKQGMLIKNCEPHLTTNVLTVGTSNIEKVIPNVTVSTDANGVTKLTPKEGIVPSSAYFDIWVITDYATMTSASGDAISGFFAIHMKNCLNVNGFRQQTTNDGKVQYSVDFRSFYDADIDEDVPYEIYYSATDLGVTISPTSASVTAGTETTFTATATGSSTSKTYQWQVLPVGASTYSDIASAITATLTLAASDVTLAASGNKYRCKVYDGTGYAYSADATLTVTSAGA